MRKRFHALLGVMFAWTTQATAATDAVRVFDGRPAAGWQVTVADPEHSAQLTGSAAVVPKSVKQPDSVVRAAVERRQGGDAVTLTWEGTWYASLRIAGAGEPPAARDLRPYLDGVLAFDLDVRKMDKGGIGFQIGCGKDCERRVPYVLPARDAAGKGWRSVSFAMRCFYRDGDDFSAIAKPFSVEANGSGEVAVANVRFEKAGKATEACPDYRTVSVTPEPLNESWSLDWWLPRHEQKLAEIAERTAKRTLPQLVFIGDSITEGWLKDGTAEWNRRYARYHAFNLGYGGDRTENILWRLQHGEVAGLDPQVVVLMAGTNNTGHRQEDPATTAAGLRKLLDELQQRLPRTKILLLGVFPRDGASDQSRRLNTAINERIARFADNRRIFYQDVTAAFVDAQGELSRDVMPDLLHPNARGYEIWGAAMDPVLQKLLQ